MAVHDRIRLTDRLPEGPRLGGALPIPPRRPAGLRGRGSTVHPVAAAPIRAAGRIASAPMELIAFLIPFVLLGGVVTFIAFTGGPGAAREAYLTRGSRTFRLVIPVLYLALGVGVPALILANRGEAAGGTGALRDQTLTADEEQGKGLFLQQCASCHNLDAVNARGVTGPDLDEIGEIKADRIVNAIKNGGTGQNRMPAGLLEGTEAEAVGAYVAKVAAR